MATGSVGMMVPEFMRIASLSFDHVSLISRIRTQLPQSFLFERQTFFFKFRIEKLAEKASSKGHCEIQIREQVTHTLSHALHGRCSVRGMFSFASFKFKE